MLKWLKIKNLALIDKADVEFSTGFNVVTGETGAGKSILLNTISLLLGSRADKSIIRTGEKRADLAASIIINNNLAGKIAPLLEEIGVPWDEEENYTEIQLKRIVSATQNRSFINDTPVTLNTLRNISQKLVDVHAANEHQSLTDQSRQLELLDRYAKASKELNACQKAYADLKALRQRRTVLLAELPTQAEAEHLESIVNEIETANPLPNEDEILSQKHAIAANAKSIIQYANNSALTLSQMEGSITDKMGEVYRELERLHELDSETTAPMLEACSLIVENIRDLSFDLENYASSVEIDDEEFSRLEDRLAMLQALKRRYGSTLSNVFAELEKAKSRLQNYREANSLREELDATEKKLRQELDVAANKLSEKRKVFAAELAEKVCAKLSTLGFQGAQVEIAFSKQQISKKGFDSIDILFSANVGEEPQPLRRIASSGEISRVMLALKTVLAAVDNIPILIFDEIDVNIGGQVANQVGEELKNLAKDRQVLCISHLAQVATKGTTHYAVAKNSADGRTKSSIKQLSHDERIDEIARMLGGSQAATAHAKDLLNPC